MPRHTEPAANSALGNLLQPMLGKALVRSENVRAIVDQPGLQPDLLITAEGRAPVVVEAEYLPAYTAEAEARSRLGLVTTAGRRRIEAVIALRYPEAVGDAEDLNLAVRNSLLSYCLFTVTKYSQTPEREIKGIDRFPESGWLEGSVSDLADLIRQVSFPQLAVDEAADVLQRGIDRAAATLEEMENTRPFINPAIARLLGMDNVPQTRRMAGAILANALVFQERLSGIHSTVKPVSQVCGPGVTNPKDDTLEAWTAILEINYWPIFDIARRILDAVPNPEVGGILRNLAYTTGEVSGTGINNAHDLTGRVFQRLIADRKYLATFYTLPESAALLARLAVAKLDSLDWADAEALGNLRVGDFACGTGALLSAVYDQIAAHHERAGGDPAQLHPAMMEEVLYGCDVMPSAVHITSATLSGAQPTVGFRKSRLYTMPYGRLNDGSVAIGSLEFLTSNAQMTLSNFSDPVLRSNGNGDEKAYQAIAEIPDESFDMVIMNPPFTRNTTNEGAYSGQFNAAFAAFNTGDAEQRDMSKRMAVLSKGTAYHGNAGVASAFAALADKKLKPGGIMALVLPLSAAAGLSWQGFRRMVADSYEDLTVLSISANGRDMSFSSDTGMAECLIIARKRKTDSTAAQRAQFASLPRRPRGFAQVGYIAKTIIDCADVRQIEDGPFGGTILTVGNELVGQMMSASDSEIWGGVRLSDYSLAQTAYALSHSKLWLPGSPADLELRTIQLGAISRIGLHHRDITGPAPRGPFNKVASSPTATYPALWNHDAKNETKMLCAPDSQLVVRPGMEAKAIEAWTTASRAHLNVEFTFGSQALGIAFTQQESIGGRVWPNVIFDDNRFDYAFTAWGNSTLGLLSCWWQASRQQSSKITLSLRTAESLSVLDLRALSDEQLTKAEEIFEEFRDKELQPAYLADADPNRALLDRRVVCDLLGFDAAVYQGVRRLAAKWCAEPSVHGGKQRPRGAALVV